MDRGAAPPIALTSSLLAALLALAPASRARAQQDAQPPAAHAPAVAAQAAPATEEPGWVDAFLDDDANVVGLITAGAGVVGGLGVCGLVALSPTCCALPLGFPIAAVTTGTGAAIAAAVMGDWSCGRLWLPALAGVFLGATTGLFASITGMITWTMLGSALGVSTFDPGAATTSTLLLVSGAGAATMAVAILGSALTGTLVRFMYALTDERPSSRSDPPRTRAPRRRPARPAPASPSPPAPAPGFEY